MVKEVANEPVLVLLNDPESGSRRADRHLRYLVPIRIIYIMERSYIRVFIINKLGGDPISYNLCLQSAAIGLLLVLVSDEPVE